MKNAGTASFSLWQDFLLLLGRVLMGWIYVESGWRKLTGMDAFIVSLTNRHVPYATVLGWIGASVEFFGGLALVLGAWARCATLAMIVFTVVATLFVHRSWNTTDATLSLHDAFRSVTNVTIIGGLVLLFV